MAQCQDNESEWDSMPWCQWLDVPVRHHYKVTMSPRYHKSVPTPIHMSSDTLNGCASIYVGWLSSLGRLVSIEHIMLLSDMLKMCASIYVWCLGSNLGRLLSIEHIMLLPDMLNECVSIYVGCVGSKSR